MVYQIESYHHFEENFQNGYFLKGEKITPKSMCKWVHSKNKFVSNKVKPGGEYL